MSFRKLLLLTALVSPISDVFAAPAGRVQFVAGEVALESVGKPARRIAKGDPIEEGDTVVTGATGQAQLLMSDEALVAVRPGTRLRVETYRYAGKADGSERGVLALLRGSFRTVTGAIGRFNHDSYRVNTPTATVGIRGTDHEPLYIPPPAPGETPIGPPGTYDKVNAGETFIENAAGRIQVGPNQAGFAPTTANVAPVRLPQIPGFMRNTMPTTPRDGDKRGGPEGQQRRGQQQGQQQAGRGPAQGPGPGGQRPPGGMPGAPGPMLGAAPGAIPMPGMMLGGLPPPGGLLPPLPPPIQGTLDPTSPPPGFVPAPNGFAATGGDLSGGGVGSGAGVVGNDFGLTLDAQGNVISVGSSGFAYARAGAPLVQQGSASLGGIPVHWGIYAGGQISDGMGVRYPSFFHFMGAPNATSPSVLLSVLASPMTFSASAANNEYTLPIAENGAVGGKVALSITLANVSSTPSVTAYNLGVQDANSRNWTASLAGGPVGLGTFLKGSGATLNVNCSACPQSSGIGSAHGAAIGASSVQGVVSSYDLKAGSAGVTGSVLAR